MRNRWKKKVSYTAYFVLMTVGMVLSQSDTSYQVGKVTYVTTQSVYVKFENTQPIQIGDTLYVGSGVVKKPVLKVVNKSSISTVCISIGEMVLMKESEVLARIIAQSTNDEPKILGSDRDNEKNREDNVDSTDLQSEVQGKEDGFKQKISGRIYLSSFSSFQEDWGDMRYRMRASLSGRVDHIQNGPLSFQYYGVYRYSMDPPSEAIRETDSEVRIFNLHLNYEWEKRGNLILGRCINPHLSNVGAIDGLQGKYKMGNWSMGGVFGFRPDIFTFSFNPDLVEYGGYLLHDWSNGMKYSQTSLAVFEQRNAGSIDRRFSYFQHSSAPTSKLFLFSSFELDWYTVQDSVTSLAPRFTSIFLSARYRFNRKFSLYGSYDGRRPIIYFESNKLYADRILEEETRQGFRFRATWRFQRFMNLGASGGYRFQNLGDNETKNVYVYWTHSRLPYLKVSMTVAYNWLQTSYLLGSIYKVRLNKDLGRGRLSINGEYRRVNYQFTTYDLNQNIYGAGMSLRIWKKLMLIAYYEGAFGEERVGQRINVNIVQRF